MQRFCDIRQRAAERKGGEKNLSKLLPGTLPPAQLAALTDSYFLSEMTRSIFQSGFVWRVINNKWPQFLDAFHGFDLNALMALDDDQWDNYLYDSRIVRHRQKIAAVRSNVWFIHDTVMQHGSFGQFLADWPENDLIGLFAHLKKGGSRLGGNTGQYFLQHVGKDCFAMTSDVVRCLKLAGVDISDNPTSQKDHRKVQQAFNDWHDETGLPYRTLSMIAAYSVGENVVLA